MPPQHRTFYLSAPHQHFCWFQTNVLQKPLACFLNLNSTVKTQGTDGHSHSRPLMRFTGKGCGHPFLCILVLSEMYFLLESQVHSALCFPLSHSHTFIMECHDFLLQKLMKKKWRTLVGTTVPDPASPNLDLRDPM